MKTFKVHINIPVKANSKQEALSIIEKILMDAGYVIEDHNFITNKSDYTFMGGGFIPLTDDEFIKIINEESFTLLP